MLNNKTIAVIVPFYNEESQIGFVIETMPSFVHIMLELKIGLCCLSLILNEIILQ